MRSGKLAGGRGKAPERRLAAEGHPDWLSRPSLRLMDTSLLMLNPPARTRLRRLVAAVFTPRRVEGLRPAVGTIVAGIELTATPVPRGRIGMHGHPSMPVLAR